MAAWTWVLRFAGEPKWATGGKMGAQKLPPALRISRFSRLLLDSSHHSLLDTGTLAGVAQAFRRLVALMMALLLLIGQGELFAQQAAYYGQYAPSPQSASLQPQPYGQPS